MFRYLKSLYYLMGIGLLSLVLYQTDLGEVSQYCVQIGMIGMFTVVALYSVIFLTDVMSWQLTFHSIPLDRRWCGRLYLVRLLGEAFNNITPLASFGGEPLKVAVLKEHYGISIRESGATLVMARTINMIALILFLLVGFALLVAADEFTGAYKLLAAAGLVFLSIGTAMMVLIQRYRVSTRVGHWLHSKPWCRRIERVLKAIEDVDSRLATFYSAHHRRFRTALVLAILNWILGVFEIYLVMDFIGHPISFWDAWIIEAMVQLIRTSAFFIPAGIGAQEGTFLLVTGVITGNPALGLAFSVVRRSRELLWIVLGLLTYGAYRSAEQGEEVETVVKIH